MNNRITWDNQPKIEFWQKATVELVKSLVWYLLKPINYVQERLVCLIRGVGKCCVRWRNCLKYLKRSGIEKRGEETKILKKGAKLGQWVGALKRGAGTNLQTIALKITSRQQSIDCCNNICDRQKASLNSHRD